MITIAVAMACRNRVAKSVNIAEQLMAQQTASIRVQIFAIDDGSTDGTGAALKKIGVHVIDGDGSLYWAGGMRVAYAAALATKPDMVLWVNDDLTLEPNALKLVCEAYNESQETPTVLVGAVTGGDGEITYGGRFQRRRNPMSFTLAGKQHLGKNVTTFNGNFVAIPISIGLETDFPPLYRHGYADLAFGLSLHEQGYQIKMLGEIIGTDDRNPNTGKMFDPSVRLTERIRFALTPFGLPIRDHYRFAQVTAGGLAPFWFGYSYFRVIFPGRVR